MGTNTNNKNNTFFVATNSSFVVIIIITITNHPNNKEPSSSSSSSSFHVIPQKRATNHKLKHNCPIQVIIFAILLLPSYLSFQNELFYALFTNLASSVSSKVLYDIAYATTILPPFASACFFSLSFSALFNLAFSFFGDSNESMRMNMTPLTEAETKIIMDTLDSSSASSPLLQPQEDDLRRDLEQVQQLVSWVEQEEEVEEE